MKALIDWDDMIRDDLNAGTFTPFLGAGAASLRSYDSASFGKYPWTNVKTTLRKIYDNVPIESREFLRNFVQQRLRLSKTQVSLLVPEASEEEVPHKADATLDLVDLQVALVNTMCHLTRIFGQAFIEQVPSLRELPDCAVRFSFARSDVRAAWSELYAAILTAKKLTRARALDFRCADSEWLPADVPPESTRRFHIAEVYERLVILARQLIAEDDQTKVKSELFEVQFQETPDLNSMGGHLMVSVVRGHLRLDMMQWLGDLLEYSLAYWIPRFPTTAELAFELGLAVPQGPPRRAELAQAAQAFRGPQATAYITDLMHYCEKAMDDDRFAPAHRRFYLAIATALCDQWDNYKSAKTAPSSLRSSGSGFFKNANQGGELQTDAFPSTAVAQRRMRAAFLPVAATTNYDCGLELVLNQYKVPYHVVFPVQGGSSPDTMLQWICRRVSHEGWPDDSEPFGSKQPLPEDIPISGPIIVKLHGAPTLERPKDRRGGHLSHKIVASEQEYLDALQGDAAQLKWFEDEMFMRLDDDGTQEPDALARAVWFLGYSIADWNVRLRLYSHLKSIRQGRKQMRAVNRDYDPFRQAILQQLQVELCHGDLNAVPRAIHGYYSDRGRLARCSETVKKLAAALLDAYAN